MDSNVSPSRQLSEKSGAKTERIEQDKYVNFGVNIYVGAPTAVHNAQSAALSDTLTTVLTWILGVASKQLRLLHFRVGDSTTVVNSLSPQMSELVEDAIAS